MDYMTPLKKNKFHIFEWDQRYVREHSHSFLELVYVLNGECVHIRDGEESVVKSGNYFVIDYFSSHAYRLIGKQVKIINCIFLPEFIDAALLSCNSFKDVISSYQLKFNVEYFVKNPSASVFYDDDGAVLKLMEEMLAEYDKKYAGYLQIIRAKMIELLVIMMRKIYAAPEFVGGKQCLQNVVKYAAENYSDDITLNEICKKLNYSVPYISASFKKEFGITYRDYIKKLKVEHSLRMLSDTKKSVSEIASAAGYGDIKSFYAAFKKITGTTPLKFRKSIFK